MKTVLKFVLFAASALLLQPVQAQTAAQPQAVKPPKKNPPAKAVKPATKAAPAAAAPAAAAVLEGDDEDDLPQDTSAATVTEFHCDHGQKITFYQNPGDNKFVALRWGKQISRMRRVETSTGADRFENRRHGLIWIGIPAKSMLLDSRKGLQLANECRNEAQLQTLKEAAKG